MPAKKRFGQNFLHDETVIKRIVDCVAAQKSDHLVEIGPGHGALTKEFLGAAARFDLIELDRDLIPELTQLCQNQCTIHQADVLRFDFNTILNENRFSGLAQIDSSSLDFPLGGNESSLRSVLDIHDSSERESQQRGKPKCEEYILTDKKLRIIGNLPYNISTPLLFHLLQYKDNIQDMHFMLQKEVAERLAATPNTKVYGRLSIMVQYHCQVKILFPVPPHSFHPIPKVKSAFVQLIPHAICPYPAKNPTLFAHIVREAFNHRRKTIHNGLKNLVDKNTWAKLNINSNARAEQLSIADFVKIANFTG